MADIITLSVKTIGGTEALTLLQNLQSVSNSLNATPITIKVSASNIKNQTSSLNDLASAAQKAEASVSGVATASQKVSTTAAQAGKSIESGINTPLKETNTIAKQTGDTFTSMIGKFTKWYAIGTLVSGVTRSFREALDTMKAVDDELVTVRKVTGATTAEIQKLEKQAYATASAYGESASDYLASVSEFARAGYGDQAEALAELSIKTQIVGDTTAETANQFLLAVDAAYKYNGEISKLSAVLDGANEIDNKYATSIEKIAEGLGTVAPIAAQAHVGIDELSAAIGTITAVTQRSGTEAARAFRALVLNIVGDTKTEIDEGVTWTTGEIAGLRDVVKQYASDAYEAAEATGSVINPMEAIAGLAKSMEEGVLTEQKLMEMVSDIGGKLRTSQLLAIIQNWDMYESMLNDFNNSLGSADREIENAMDSWSRKAQVLSNTWTELISNTVDTDLIKWMLDAATAVLDFSDNLLLLTTTIGGLIAVVKSASLAKTGIATALGIGAGPIAWIGMAVSAIGVLTMSILDYQETMAEKRQATIDEALAATNNVKVLESLYGAYEQAKENGDDLTSTSEELLYALGYEAEAVDTLTERYGSLDAAIQTLMDDEREYAQLKAQAGLAESEEQVLETANEDNDFSRVNPNFLSSSDNRAMVALTNAGFDTTIDYGEGRYSLSFADPTNIEESKELLNEYNRALDVLNSSLSIEEKGSSEVLAWLLDQVEALEETIDEYDKMAKAAGVVNDEIEETADSVSDSGDSVNETATSLEQMAENLSTAVESTNEELDQLQSAIESLQAAQEEYNETGTLSVDTIQELLSLGSEYIDALVDEDGQINLTSSSLENLVSKKNDLLQALAAESVATYAVTSLQNLMAESSDNVGESADDSTTGIENAANSMLELAAQGVSAAVAVNSLDAALSRLAGENDTSGIDVEAWKEDVKAYASDVISLINAAGSGVSAGGGGGGGGSATDKALEAHEDLIALLKSELQLLEDQGRPVQDQVSKMKEIQDALHQEAEYLRSIEASQTEINALSSEWWSIQRDILALQEELWSELESAVDDKLEEAADARDKELDAIQAQIDALKEAAEVEDRQLEIEEKRLAVAEAQDALLNAQRERNVRVYNAEKKQWDWVANASDVMSAEEALEDAQKDLDEYMQELALDAEIEALEKRKEQIEQAYDAFEQEWDNILESIEEPGRDIGEILADIANNGTPLMKQQVDRVNELLGDLGNYINGFVTGVTGAETETPAVGVTGTGMGNGRDYSNDTTDYAQKMLEAQSWDEFSYYAQHRQNKIDALGIDVGAAGYPTNEELYDMWKSNQGTSSSGSSSSSSSSSGSSSSSSSSGSSGSGSNMGAGVISGVVGAIGTIVGGLLGGKKYDSGGILHGIGGIKATGEDEAVLGPELTAAMLSPNSDAVFRKRVMELGYLYGAKGGYSIQRAGMTVNGGSTVTNSGSTYYFNGVEIGERSAEQMTVASLARQLKTLALYTN